MSIYCLDPLNDGRWDDLIASHPSSSAFHQRGWLKALAQTYGYRPLVLTTSRPGEKLEDAIVFCEVNSWITGRRLVSLPFADHAEPFVISSERFKEIVGWAKAQSRQRGWKYIELRPTQCHGDLTNGMEPAQSFWLHTLDLTAPLDQLYRGLHKDCIQRKIRKAERSTLSYEKGVSAEFLDDFYRLLTMTRRRHRVPPQPRHWFSNLIACMAPNAEIRIARHNGNAISALFSLRHKETVVYKYACSDERFHSLGAAPFLIWRLIEESKMAGAQRIDFGRTDPDNEGLIEFKDRLGAARSRLTYCRYQVRGSARAAPNAYASLAKRSFTIMPDSALSFAGRLLYKHFG